MRHMFLPVIYWTGLYVCNLKTRSSKTKERLAVWSVCVWVCVCVSVCVCECVCVRTASWLSARCLIIPLLSFCPRGQMNNPQN